MAKKTVTELLRLARKEVVDLKRALRLANTLMDKDHKEQEEAKEKLQHHKDAELALGNSLKRVEKENRELNNAQDVSKNYVRMLLKEGEIIRHTIVIKG